MIRIKFITTALTISLLTLATDASAQAFGIEKGTPIGSLDILKEVGQFIYSIEVPKPHSEFESYMAFATPEIGVCTVNGIGKDHDNDRYGATVRGAFSNLRGALEKLYGPYTSFDFIKDGALWDDPEEWVMAIHQNERFHAAFWTREDKSDLPEGLSGISLTVKTLSSDKSYITLGYEFDNMSECVRIDESANEGGL